MPMDRLWTLVRSVLALAQLIVFSVVAPFYGIAFLIVGALNLVYVLVTGSKLGGIDLLIEPLRWAVHQSKVLIGASDDFRAAPYV